MKNEIRTELNGAETTHYRVVINYSATGTCNPNDNSVSEWQTGKSFPTLSEAKHFIQSDETKAQRKEAVRAFKVQVPESARPFKCWSVLEYVPTKINGVAVKG